MTDWEEIRREAKRLLEYHQKGSKGGRVNSEKQRQTRNENLKRARWKRYHPNEPYPDTPGEAPGTGVSKSEHSHKCS